MDSRKKIIKRARARARKKHPLRPTEPRAIQIVQENGAVLEPHFALIRNQTVEQKANLKLRRREQLMESRNKLDEKFQQNERASLLTLFPNELWIKVLNALDCEDKANCCKASGLFSNILNHTKLHKSKFHKTLPHFIKYLRYDDLLSCVKSFPDWRFSVLSVTQDHIHNPCKIVEAKKPFQGQFKFIETDVDNHFVQEYKTYNRHEISLKARRQNSELSNFSPGENITLRASYHPEFFSEFVNFLSARGHKIQYLTLIGEKISISPAMLYMLCQQILKSCKSLKGLTVKDWRFVNWTDSESDVVSSVLAQPPLMDHKNLVELNVDFGHPMSLVIANRLMKKYSKQLKSASVTILEQPFYQIYKNFDFSRLREICAPHGNINKVFLLLNQINAPNLQKLTVTLDKTASNLDLFLSVIWKFPKLCMLDLKVSTCFNGWLNRQILDVSPIQCAVHHLQKLKVNLQSGDICLDFLISFPHLKELHFANYRRIFERKISSSVNRHREVERIHVEDYQNFEITEPEFPNNAQADIAVIADKMNQQVQANNKLFRAPKVDREEKRRSENDLIQLDILPDHPSEARYKIDNVYESNIWERLPSLQIIRFEKKLYSREKYNWNKLDYASTLENRIRLIENEVDKRNKEKSLKLRNSFKNTNFAVQQNLSRIIANTRSFISDELWEITQKCIKFPEDVEKFPELANILEDTRTQTLFSEVFPMIYGQLSKNDTLKCRMVCKQWTAAVNHFLENVPSTHKMVPMKENLTRFLETFKFWYQVQLPSELNLFPELMRQHCGNPFIGRSVEIFVNSFSSFVKYFDASLAIQIWHVKITFTKYLDLVEYFQLLLEVVKTFPNLRFLYIGHAKVDYIAHNQQDIDFKTVLEVIPPLHTLILHSSANVQHIHAQLLTLFWPHLKRLVIVGKGTELSNAPNVCRNEIIEELEIPGTLRANCFKSLKSSHLKHLCIELKDDDGRFLNMSGDIISSGLQTLKMSVSESFTGFKEASLVRVDPTIASSISKLILTVENVKTFSFDILILFPFLRKLVLELNYCASSSFRLDSANDLKRDYVNLKKFLFKDDKLAMYRSKVWQIPPYLEVIKVVFQDAWIRKIFTRTEHNARSGARGGEEMVAE